MTMNRRAFVTAGALSTMTVAAGAFAKNKPEPQRSSHMGGTLKGPRNLSFQKENPTLLNPPKTDNGSLPNLWFPFDESHTRQETGGWTRQVATRELPAATTIAGVQMRLNKGGIRALHWHKEAEWGFVEYGKVRITMIDPYGHYYIDDLGPGNIFYFPAAFPHSLQGLEPDGTQYLLAFDDGDFDENQTFMFNDWLVHTPPEILAQNLGISQKKFEKNDIPGMDNRFIFAAETPDQDLNDIDFKHASKTKDDYAFRLGSKEPDFESEYGSVRIADTNNFKVSKTIATALVEIEPGGLREMHWHANNDEWQYYLQGKGQIGVFGASSNNRTFDVHGGDVGYIPFAMGHYIYNDGDEPLRFLEMFKSDEYNDVSLRRWMAMTPKKMIQQHLNMGDELTDSLDAKERPVAAIMDGGDKKAQKDKDDD